MHIDPKPRPLLFPGASGFLLSPTQAPFSSSSFSFPLLSPPHVGREQGALGRGMHVLIMACLGRICFLLPVFFFPLFLSFSVLMHEQRPEIRGGGRAENDNRFFIRFRQQPPPPFLRPRTEQLRNWWPKDGVVVAGDFFFFFSPFLLPTVRRLGLPDSAKVFHAQAEVEGGAVVPFCGFFSFFFFSFLFFSSFFPRISTRPETRRMVRCRGQRNVTRPFFRICFFLPLPLPPPSSALFSRKKKGGQGRSSFGFFPGFLFFFFFSSPRT